MTVWIDVNWKWIYLSGEIGRFLITKNFCARIGSPPEDVAQLAHAIYQDFDQFFDYYQTEIEKAYHAEINSVVYGMG